jgi:hypothetical protein
MRQAESKNKEQQKELKRKVLVDSTHWTLKPQAKIGEAAVVEEEEDDDNETPVSQSSVGFSDLYEANTTTVGRRGYGKKPEPVEDEADSDNEDNNNDESEKESEDGAKGKRKTSNSSDDDDEESNFENERKRRKQEQKDFNILRKFKSISGSTSVSNSKRAKR